MRYTYDRKANRWLPEKPPRARKNKAELLAEAEDTLTNDELAEAVKKGKESPAKPNKAATKKNK